MKIDLLENQIKGIHSKVFTLVRRWSCPSAKYCCNFFPVCNIIFKSNSFLKREKREIVFYGDTCDEHKEYYPLFQ